MRTIVTEKEQSSYTAKIVKGVTNITIIDKIPIDSTDFEQCVKVVLFLKDKSQYEIAKALGVQQPAVLSKCRKGRFTFEELRRLADIMECKVVIKFVFNDGAEIEADTARNLILSACEHAHITLTDLAARMGKTKQAISDKAITGKFTIEEMREVAKCIGCRYSNYFELENGLRI